MSRTAVAGLLVMAVLVGGIQALGQREYLWIGEHLVAMQSAIEHASDYQHLPRWQTAAIGGVLADSLGGNTYGMSAGDGPEVTEWLNANYGTAQPSAPAYVPTSVTDTGTWSGSSVGGTSYSSYRTDYNAGGSGLYNPSGYGLSTNNAAQDFKAAYGQSAPSYAHPSSGSSYSAGSGYVYTGGGYSYPSAGSGYSVYPVGNYASGYGYSPVGYSTYGSGYGYSAPGLSIGLGAAFSGNNSAIGVSLGYNSQPSYSPTWYTQAFPGIGNAVIPLLPPMFQPYGYGANGYSLPSAGYAQAYGTSAYGGSVGGSSGGGGAVAPTCVIALSPTSIPSGGSTQASWTAYNASSAFLNSFGGVALSGSQQLRNRTSSETVGLIVTGSGGTGACYALLTVGSASAGIAPTCQISANPGTILPGQGASIAWNAENAVSASLSGLGDVPLQSGQSAYPSQTATYVLTVTGSDGRTASCSTRIVVQ